MARPGGRQAALKQSRQAGLCKRRISATCRRLSALNGTQGILALQRQIGALVADFQCIPGRRGLLQRHACSKIGDAVIALGLQQSLVEPNHFRADHDKTIGQAERAAGVTYRKDFGEVLYGWRLLGHDVVRIGNDDGA